MWLSYLDPHSDPSQSANLLAVASGGHLSLEQQQKRTDETRTHAPQQQTRAQKQQTRLSLSLSLSLLAAASASAAQVVVEVAAAHNEQGELRGKHPKHEMAGRAFRIPCADTTHPPPTHQCQPLSFPRPSTRPHQAAAASAAAQLGGDPRRPEDARRFPRAAAGADDEQLDTALLVAMGVGLLAFVLKVRCRGCCAAALMRAERGVVLVCWVRRRQLLLERRMAGRKGAEGIRGSATTRCEPTAATLHPLSLPTCIPQRTQHTTQAKALAWAAVCCAAYAVATAGSRTGIQHICSAVLFSFVSLMGTYTHEAQLARQAAAAAGGGGASGAS